MKSLVEVETLEVAKHNGRCRRLAAPEERKKLLAVNPTVQAVSEGKPIPLVLLPVPSKQALHLGDFFSG